MELTDVFLYIRSTVDIRIGFQLLEVDLSLTAYTLK